MMRRSHMFGIDHTHLTGGRSGGSKVHTVHGSDQKVPSTQGRSSNPTATKSSCSSGTGQIRETVQHKLMGIPHRRPQVPQKVYSRKESSTTLRNELPCRHREQLPIPLLLPRTRRTIC